jgi:hypothetical protein
LRAAPTWAQRGALAVALAWGLLQPAGACEKTLRRNPAAPHLVVLPNGERSGP